jgi:hypothetical protein
MPPINRLTLDGRSRLKGWSPTGVGEGTKIDIPTCEITQSGDARQEACSNESTNENRPTVISVSATAEPEINPETQKARNIS